MIIVITTTAKQCRCRSSLLHHCEAIPIQEFAPASTRTNESTPDDIPVRLNQIINTIIESDLAYIQDYGSGTAF